MGCALISSKLVKIPADQLAESLTCIINPTITQSIFPSKAQEASLQQLIKEETINIHF